MPEIYSPELQYVTTSRRSRTTGLRFPMSNTSEGGSLSKAHDKELLLQSVRQILLTRKGERVMYPNFGANLDDFLFEPLTTELKTQMQTRITESLSTYEPRIVVKKCEIVGGMDIDGLGTENSKVFIRLTFGFSTKFFDEAIMEVIVQ